MASDWNSVGKLNACSDLVEHCKGSSGLAQCPHPDMNSNRPEVRTHMPGAPKGAFNLLQD